MWRAIAHWSRVEATTRHSEVLLAVLNVAAQGLQLAGFVGARLGRGVPSLEGIMERSHDLLSWWSPGRPELSWHAEVIGAAASSKVHVVDLFGRGRWRETAFVQCICVDDSDVEALRKDEQEVPDLGSARDPDV